MSAGLPTVPDLCSVFRLAMSPVMLLLAYGEKPILFVFSFAAALVSDVVDGFLARRLHVASDSGARLDSWSDLFMYWGAAFGVLLLAPDLIAKEKGIVSAMALAYLVPVVVGFVKFRRLTSYHTWGAKLSAVLGGGTILAMILFGRTEPLWITGPVFIVSSVEEMGITAVLPAWRANVPSLWHALRLRRTWRKSTVEAPSAPG